MPDYTVLLTTIKQAAIEAAEAGNPVNICYGKVTSVSPLQVLVDQKMTLGSAQLVLTRNVTDYEVSVTVDWETEKDLTIAEHAHSLNGEKKMTIHNSLSKGDEVVLLRQQGGQKYIIIDRVV